MENMLSKLYAKRARLNAQLNDPVLRQDSKLCDRLCKELEDVEKSIDIANFRLFGGVAYGDK